MTDPAGHAPGPLAGEPRVFRLSWDGTSAEVPLDYLRERGWPVPDLVDAARAVQIAPGVHVRLLSITGTAGATGAHIAVWAVPGEIAAVLKEANDAALKAADEMAGEAERFWKIAEEARSALRDPVAALSASQAYDRSARTVRDAITRALLGEEPRDG
jgi:hypothetical protein